MREFYVPFEKTLKEAETKIENVEIPDEVTDVICEKCGRNMVIKTDGMAGSWPVRFPECRMQSRYSRRQGQCPLCGGKVLIKKTRTRKSYLGVRIIQVRLHVMGYAIRRDVPPMRELHGKEVFRQESHACMQQ